MMDETQIEFSKSTTGGAIVSFNDNAVIIRRNVNHPEQMTTIRFVQGDGPTLIEADWSPLAFPFMECDMQDPETGFGWGTSVYLWLCFGTEAPPSIPEPAWPEIRRFASFLAACLDEHSEVLDG